MTVFCLMFNPIKGQNVLIPDANFKMYLVGNALINTNGDTEIQVSEANAFSGEINCQLMGITNLTGIEAFINLTSLNCSVNQIPSLNLSQSTKLEKLICYGNWLTNIDVSQNPKLRELICYTNGISALDVSQNPDLTVLACYLNGISSLDVSQNPALITLSVIRNQLTSLDVSQNPNLVNLYCDENQLTTLDLSQNPNLFNFQCKLNHLTSLNVKNGNNTNIINFQATGNPNLTCIEVDDPIFSTGSWTTIDATASFNTVCGTMTDLATINDNLENISVGPNPINNEITLNLGKMYSKVSIEICTLMGQVVLQKEMERIERATIALTVEKGLYLVKVSLPDGMTTFKILKT